MVSKAVASLDQWLAQADQVLRETREVALSPSMAAASENVTHEWDVSLGSFELGVPDLLNRLCSRPGRWILIAEDAHRPHRFWQAMAFEDGSLVAEAGSGTPSLPSERLTTAERRELARLGWEAPGPPSSPNWRRVEATTSPDVEAVAAQCVATLRNAYGISTDDRLLLTLFASPRRGGTPASEQLPDDIPGLEEAAPRRGFRPTTEPWADYYRQLYPGHEHPASAFAAWKYATTAVGAACSYWEARERARLDWEDANGSDPATWPISHPPVVLYLPQVARAGCLACTWFDRADKSDVQSAAELAVSHAVEHGVDQRALRGFAVPVSGRSGDLTSLEVD
jgi:hypothetical protein